MTAAVLSQALLAKLGGVDQFTKLLVHADGANASTTFVDLSSVGRTLTSNGGCAIETAQSKFGPSSARIATADGTTNAYISAPASSDWNMSNGDFTVEFWIRYNSTANDAGIGYQIINNYTSAGNRAWRFGHFNGAYEFDWTTDGSTGKSATWSSAISTGSWDHIALVRSSTSIDCYKNGSVLTRAGTNISTDTIFNASATVLALGGASDASWGSINGWLDEVRISKGIARWTANFTPPGVPYS